MNKTQLFLLVIAVTMIIFDIYIICLRGKSESISAHVIRNYKKYPLMVLLFGILLGHLFWNMPTESVYKNTERFQEDSVKIQAKELK